MSMNVFTQTDADITKDVNDIILDLPIAAENKLRAKMLISIFTSYGKYQLNNGISFPKVKEELVTILSQFKEKNGTFCNADYSIKVLENVGQYAAYKAQLKREITQSFLADSAEYLKKYVSDIDIVNDLTKAEESLYIEKPAGIYGFTLAMNYFDQCKSLIRKSCNMNVDFLNSID